MKSIDRLIDAECFAYGKWVRSGCRSVFWRRLASAMNAMVKNHPSYRGVR